MARIDWVRQRLDNWARWASQREAGALGYPKQAAFARLAPGGSSMGSAVPVDSLDASITDDAVKSFRWTHPHLHLTLKHHYIDGLEIKRVALKMSRAESTIKAHLEQADHLIATWFRVREDGRAKIQGGFTT
jgi:Phage antitermination protein Q